MNDALFNVNGLAVLVGGGAGGLGKVLAQSLAERGAKITVGDLVGDSAAMVADGLPGTGHSSCTLDVRNEDSCKAAVAVAAEPSSWCLNQQHGWSSTARLRL